MNEIKEKLIGVYNPKNDATLSILMTCMDLTRNL